MLDSERTIEPALRLWAAVVRRAAVDWVLYKDHADVRLRQLYTSANTWLFESGPGNVFSFEDTCGFLNVPPGLIRSKIRNLTEEEARRLRGMEFGDE